MQKKKTLEALINSIYNLVKEAEENYQNILNNDLKEIEKNRLVHESKSLLKDNVIEGVMAKKIFKPSVDKAEHRKEINWEKIDFKNKFKFPHTNQKDNLRVNNEKKIQITNRFKKLLDIWAENNLKTIVETEFSNYIKKIKP